MAFVFRTPRLVAASSLAPAPSKPPSAFVGDYEAAPEVVFEVTFQDGSFHVTPPHGAPQPLVPESGATHAVGRAGSTVTTTFLVDASGAVVGMLTRRNGAERTMRKVR
jgi:hypothetical protein